MLTLVELEVHEDVAKELDAVPFAISDLALNVRPGNVFLLSESARIHTGDMHSAASQRHHV